jgi:enamine deaminase RidA (YjgF/YER057c/UK114 family)
VTKRINLPSGAKWEDIIGYSRAVKVGNIIEVSGTASVDKNNEIVGLNNPYEQTKFILSKIESSLHSLGSSLKDVVRTRIFVVNINQWEEIGKAHGEVFHKIKPVTSMIEVKSLIEPGLLVEIEVTAILSH